MSSLFKPMLAIDADLTKLVFPLLASAKLDGVRAVVREGVVYSRSNKPIPNKEIQRKFGCYEHFDGELIFRDPTSKSCYRDTLSVVMSHDKSAEDVRFYVFDHIERPTVAYMHRSKALIDLLWENRHKGVVPLRQAFCYTLEDILSFEATYLAEGYEGLILRSLDAPYKMGRSTVKEGYLLKLKRFADAEATIIGFEERMENTNEKTTNELGRSCRSSHAAGKIGRNDLGALHLRTAQGIEFACGTGFDDKERKQIWDSRATLLGSLVKYKHFTVGAKDAPRHPVFLGFREKIDL